MASPSELSLECKPNSNSMLLKSFGDHQMSSAGFDQTHQSKLEEFLARLEEERLKIDAFKRELPLCMQLLTNALEASRQQLQAYRSKQGTGTGARPVLEEFIPLKTPNSSDNNISDNTGSDKANWMTTAQLWSQTETKPQPSPASPPKEAELGFGVVSSQLTLDAKQRNGGAFLPFSKDRAAPALPELALASSAKDMDGNKCQPEASATQAGAKASGSSMDHSANNNAGLSNNNSSNCNANNTNGSANQPHRKARRCWSPDLHRRFVNALQMLGGSQVATPKQIRELMKVDGLTNDEVKSHLQKYRLHTRRPSPTPQAAGAPAPQLVVLGGIWVPPEYATAAHTAASPALYGAHHAAAAHAQPHFCASPVPQDFYSAAAVVAASPATQAGPPPNQLHHHAIHHQLHMLKAQTQFHSSPESNVRGAGDQSESIEDGKSESSSWKGDSGDNGGDGERKGLAALREEGEESNGSDITLKF